MQLVEKHIIRRNDIRYKELISNDEIWNTFIKDFNEMSIKKLSYSNSTTEELDKINAMLDDQNTLDTE